jgi:hypothetical protein
VGEKEENRAGCVSGETSFHDYEAATPNTAQETGRRRRRVSKGEEEGKKKGRWGGELGGAIL